MLYFHQNIIDFDWYHIALWFFLIISLLASGFFLGIARLSWRITATPRGFQFIFIGRAVNSAILAYVAWEALKTDEGTLDWIYWVFTVGAVVTLIGLIWAYKETRNIAYGRRSTDDPKRRREDL